MTAGRNLRGESSLSYAFAARWRGSTSAVPLIETRTMRIPCPHLHLYREGYGDRWAVPLPAERFSDAGDPWLLLLEFMQFVNITVPPDIRRGLFT
jgi:uncharacterized protein DUF6978